MKIEPNLDNWNLIAKEFRMWHNISLRFKQPHKTSTRHDTRQDETKQNKYKTRQQHSRCTQKAVAYRWSWLLSVGLQNIITFRRLQFTVRTY